MNKTTVNYSTGLIGLMNPEPQEQQPIINECSTLKKQLITIFSALELVFHHQDEFKDILNQYLKDTELTNLDWLSSIVTESKFLMEVHS